jgi:5,10-methylenetetrahydromethanopterin reductase
MRWAEVSDYVRTLRTLLRGELAEHDGALLGMLHGQGSTAARPMEVPLLIAADGPRGQAIARELGDGVFVMRQPSEPVVPELSWRATFVLGTVLDPGETWNSGRARAATEASVAINYHLVYEAAGPAVDELPGGRRWRESVESEPESVRHLRMNAGHLVSANRHDRLVLDEAYADNASLPIPALSGETWRARLEGLAAMGITELTFQPMGPDIERELTAFAAMAGLDNRRPGPCHLMVNRPT